MNTHDALATLLHPLAIDAFFSTYWEQSPVHIERSDEDHFSAILNVQSIDTLISSTELYFPDVQLIRQTDGPSTESYTDNDKRILPLRLIEHYAAGATLTIAKADAKLAALGAYCRKLQSEWQMQSHANLYLSPPGHQGFNPHYDTHDVFIIQISGKKRFNFYSNNTELPFNEDKFDADSFKPGKKTEEITVTAGDTLYIPRGITHDAIALDQSPSLHITLGVYPVTMRDLLQDIIQLAAEHDARLRQSISLTAPAVFKNTISEKAASESGIAVTDPTGQNTKTNTRSAALAGIETQLKDVINDMLTAENIDKTISVYQEQVAIQCKQDSRGLLINQHSPRKVTEASVIRVRPGMVFGIETNLIDGNPVTTLRSPGQVVEFQDPMGAAVQWLVQHQHASISEIPLLATAQKFALIDQLQRQNIITIE